MVQVLNRLNGGVYTVLFLLLFLRCCVSGLVSDWSADCSAILHSFLAQEQGRRERTSAGTYRSEWHRSELSFFPFFLLCFLSFTIRYLTAVWVFFTEASWTRSRQQSSTRAKYRMAEETSKPVGRHLPIHSQNGLCNLAVHLCCCRQSLPRIKHRFLHVCFIFFFPQNHNIHHCSTASSF